MAIPSGFAARREVRAKGALPDTIQPWAMVDPLLGTVLENRVPARLYTRRRKLRDITRTALAALVPTTKPRSK